MTRLLRHSSGAMVGGGRRHVRSAWAMVFVGWLAWGVARAEAFEPTFADWQAACAALPSNRSLLGTGRVQRSSSLPGFAPLGHWLDRFFGVATNGLLGRAEFWVGEAAGRETFLNVERSWFTEPPVPFQPFAEKLVVPAGTRVVLQGDLHGDIRSLLAVLGRLQKRGWLEGFRIREPDVHLAFLGDYTDRGQYGAEVLYTLLRLKVGNPDRVHLVRGNHEDVSLVARYGFLAEGEAKFGRGFNAARLLRAYDFLPVVLYLGCGTNFVQLCHGGMEPGFHPGPLLEAPGNRRGQLLGPLRQLAFLKQRPGWLADEPEAATEVRRQFRDFVPAMPTAPSVVGFLWNDFTVFSDEPGFAVDPDRAFVYGRSAVEELLATANAGPFRVHAVIRGHQHAALPNPLMRRLLAGRGLFRHWQEKDSAGARDATGFELANRVETNATRALPPASVWTLNVTPDSVYGVGCGFEFASVSVLEVGAALADWRLTVEPVDVQMR